MDFFTSYILSIVGIVLLGVIVDLIFVDGQVKKYVRSIYVLFIIFTLVAPLPKFFDNLKNGDFSLPTSEIKVEQSYIDIVLEQRNQAMQKIIKKAFEEKGYQDIEVQVSGVYEQFYEVDKITISTRNMQEKLQRKTIVEVVKSVIKIDEEAIIIK